MDIEKAIFQARSAYFRKELMKIARDFGLSIRRDISFYTLQKWLLDELGKLKTNETIKKINKT